MDLLIHACGWAGMFTIVLAYYLVSNGKFTAADARYQWMNLIGSAAIGVHVFYQKAWAAVALEIIWAAIAIGALARLNNKGERSSL